MTAQIGDKYTFKGSHYSIVEMDGRMDFDPNKYGLTPFMACTACWDGYWCEYDITDEGIFLETLCVNDRKGNYPDINGVKVSNKNRMGHHVYENLHLKMNYTGKILVGDNFLQEYYIHMGYQRAEGYEKLTEFVFEDGMLVQENDNSDIAAALRALLAKAKELEGSTEKEYRKLGEEMFPMDMRKRAWWLFRI